MKMQHRNVLAAGLLAGMAAAATAQTDEETTDPPSTPVNAADTLSPLQARTNGAIRTLCPQMVALNREGQLNETQQELLTACGLIVRTGNALFDDLEGGTANRLDVDAEGLAAVLQQVSGEEGLAASNFATEALAAHTAVLTRRLAALRSGAALSVASTGLVAGGAAGDGDSRFAVFANVRGGFGDDDGSDEENGFDFDNGGLTVGGDYRLRDDLIVGVAVGLDLMNADYDESAAVAGGGIDATGFNVTAFSTYYQGDFYVDATASFGVTDFDIDRVVRFPGASDTDADADTDSIQFGASIGAGYDIRRGPLVFGPTLRLSYQHIEVDGYTDDGGALALRVEDQDIDSLVSALGVQAQRAFSAPFGVVTAQASAEWLHEFADDGQRIKSFYVNDPTGTALTLETDDPDRDFFSVAIAATTVLRNGVQAYLQYETLLGHEDVEAHLFTIGGRWEF